MTYIYESPDRGKTIYRREFNNYKKREKIMENRHPQLEQTYDKIISVIVSCKTITQLEGANRMIKNFKIMYKEVGYPKVLLYSLENALQKQHIKCQL